MIGHTLSEFAAHLLTIEADIKLADEVILERACQIIEKAAKQAIGTYKFGWERLAQSTQEQRSRLGYANEPLLRTGELRASISHYVEGKVGYVGSTSKVMLAQELGTKHIPPRSVLGAAAMQNEHRIHEMAIAIVSGIMAHGGPNYHLFKTLLHEIHRVYHALKEVLTGCSGR